MIKIFNGNSLDNWRWFQRRESITAKLFYKTSTTKVAISIEQDK